MAVHVNTFDARALEASVDNEAYMPTMTIKILDPRGHSLVAITMWEIPTTDMKVYADAINDAREAILAARAHEPGPAEIPAEVPATAISAPDEEIVF